MEDAKVTNDAVQPTGYPMLVTDDDLKHELGEWMVTSLNKDKIIQRVVAQQVQLTQQANEAVEAASVVPGLKKSNDLLGEKNRALAESIETFKADVKGARSELAQAIKDSKEELVRVEKKAKADLAEYEKRASEVLSRAEDRAKEEIASLKKSASDELAEITNEYEERISLADAEISNLTEQLKSTKKDLATAKRTIKKMEKQ